MATRLMVKAKKAKADEFYTQLSDIEEEMKYYIPHFKDKVVFCNCDDPYESNFFRYFVRNFNRLELKKLIATCYGGSLSAFSHPAKAEYCKVAAEIGGRAYKIEVTKVEDCKEGCADPSDVNRLLQSKENTLTLLEGDGDFRSEECTELLKQTDIVVTNPPFSLFREYVAQLVKFNKQFLIIGNVNCISYKEVFALIKNSVLWLGASIHSGDREFRVPEDYPLNAAGCRVDEYGRRYIRVKGVRWITNLDYPQRHENLALHKKYSQNEYPKYDNYDAINVNRTVEIPCDYYGCMGVPITFMDKYNPDQFEILGMAASTGYKPEIVGIPFLGGKDARPLIDGKNTYARIFIKRKSAYLN